MSKYSAWAFILAIFCSAQTYAQGVVTVAKDIDENITANNNTTATSSDSPNLTLLPQLSSSIGAAATNNLLHPEQVFCYQVATPPQNYQGYTLNGMAIVSFCGIINDKVQQIFSQKILNNPQSLSFDSSENCIIRPQIMLRYVRGVDATDVLLSSPCHALAIFYGGSVKVFNAKPSAGEIDSIIKPLLNNKVEFISPALFNQSLPIGVAKTDEQKQILQKKNKPIRQWQQTIQEQSAKSAGWNKLKSN